MKPPLSLVLLALLPSCIAGRVNLPPPSGPDVTILVHGYRGSFLRNADETAWVRVGQTLGRGSTSLALPFDGQRPGKRYQNLRADGPLTGLTVIPWLVEQEIYGDFLRFGRKHLPGMTAFSYDWRQDIRASSAELCRFIDNVVATHGPQTRIHLVAHSMGGLVTAHCLRYGAEGLGQKAWAAAAHVRSVVFVGTPFGGSPGIFDDLLLGTQVGRNTHLISPDAMLTFAAAFQLMPHAGDFLHGAAVAAPDPLQADSWIQNGWGVFQDSSLRNNPAYRAQLVRMLDAHAALTQAIAKSGDVPPPFKTLVIIGTGRPATSGFGWTAKGLDLKAETTADGDGVVLAQNAKPPPGYVFEQITSKAEHVALPSDDQVQQAIERFIKNAQ